MNFTSMILGHTSIFDATVCSIIECHLNFLPRLSCVQSIDLADKDAWRDKGMGQLSIKCKEGVTKGTKESKPTIVIRNDVC